MECAEGEGVGQPDARGRGCGATSTRAAARDAARRSRSRRSGPRSPTTSRCSTSCSTCSSAGGLDAPARHRGRRSRTAHRRRVAADLAAGWRRSSATRVVLDAPVRADRATTPTGVTVHAERHRRSPRAARDRRDAADAHLPDRLRPAGPRRCATSSPSAIPQGAVIKCMAIYDRAVLARPTGLIGPGDQHRRARSSSTSTTRRPTARPGVLLGFLEGNQARKLGAWQPDAARAAVVGCFERLFGREAGSPLDYVERPGPTRSGRAAATACSCRRAPGPPSGRAARAGRPDPLGRRRDRRPSGAATWTARSAPATARQRPLQPRLWRLASVSPPPERAPLKGRTPERGTTE